MKQSTILGGLLALSLLGSYMTWTSDGEDRVVEGVAVVDVTPAQLTSISFDAGDKAALVERRSDERGEYVWVTFTERTTTEVAPPEPEPDTDEPADDASEDDDEGMDEADGAEDDDADEAPEAEEGAPEAEAEPEPEEDAPEPETITTEEVTAFAGNDSADQLWESFAPLIALRELTLTPDADMAAFGLDEPEGTMVVTTKAGETRFELGGEAFGTRDRYVKAGSKVFLIDDKTLRPLEFANTRLVERALVGLKDADITTAEVSRDGDTRRFVRGNANDPANAYWADATAPDDADAEAATWLDKALKMRAQSYVADADVTLATQALFTLVVIGEDGTAWPVQVIEGTDADGEAQLYARSAFLRSTVKLTRSLAQGPLDDLDGLFDGGGAEEPAPADDAEPGEAPADDAEPVEAPADEAPTPE